MTSYQSGDGVDAKPSTAELELPTPTLPSFQPADVIRPDHATLLQTAHLLVLAIHLARLHLGLSYPRDKFTTPGVGPTDTVPQDYKSLSHTCSWDVTVAPPPPTHTHDISHVFIMMLHIAP